MVLSDSSNFVNEREIYEFRDIVQTQLNFVNAQISELSSNESSQKKFLPLILSIVSFASILALNWELLLAYWIPSIFILILVMIVINTIDYLRMVKKARIPMSFKNIKEFKIAFLLTLKSILMNFNLNEISFFIILLFGWLIMIYNYLENHIGVDLVLFVVYTLVLIFDLVVITLKESLYQLFASLLSNFGTSISDGISQDGFFSAIYNLQLKKLGEKTNKSLVFFPIFLILLNAAIALLLYLIFFNFPNLMTWDYLKNVIPVAIFQFLILVSLITFLSFKLAEETYENQKVMLIRILTFLEKSKQNIDKQQLDDGKIFYKRSKIFLGKRVVFFLVFTKWTIEINGELNNEENYNWLIDFLNLPPEPKSE